MERHQVRATAGNDLAMSASGVERKRYWFATVPNNLIHFNGIYSRRALVCSCLACLGTLHLFLRIFRINSNKFLYRIFLISGCFDGGGKTRQR